MTLSSVKAACVLGKNPKTRTFELAFVLKKSSKKVLIHFDLSPRNFDRAFLLDKLQSSVKINSRSLLPNIELWSNYLSPDFRDKVDDAIEALVSDREKLKGMLQTLYHLYDLKNSLIVVGTEDEVGTENDAWVVENPKIMDFVSETLH